MDNSEMQVIFVGKPCEVIGLLCLAAVPVLVVLGRASRRPQGRRAGRFRDGAVVSRYLYRIYLDWLYIYIYIYSPTMMIRGFFLGAMYIYIYIVFYYIYIHIHNYHMSHIQ